MNRLWLVLFCLVGCCGFVVFAQNNGNTLVINTEGLTHNRISIKEIFLSPNGIGVDNNATIKLLGAQGTVQSNTVESNTVQSAILRATTSATVKDMMVDDNMTVGKGVTLQSMGCNSNDPDKRCLLGTNNAGTVQTITDFSKIYFENSTTVGNNVFQRGNNTSDAYFADTQGNLAPVGKDQQVLRVGITESSSREDLKKDAALLVGGSLEARGGLRIRKDLNTQYGNEAANKNMKMNKNYAALDTDIQGGKVYFKGEKKSNRGTNEDIDVVFSHREANKMVKIGINTDSPTETFQVHVPNAKAGGTLGGFSLSDHLGKLQIFRVHCPIRGTCGEFRNGDAHIRNLGGSHNILFSIPSYWRDPKYMPSHRDIEDLLNNYNHAGTIRLPGLTATAAHRIGIGTHIPKAKLHVANDLFEPRSDYITDTNVIFSSKDAHNTNLYLGVLDKKWAITAHKTSDDNKLTIGYDGNGVSSSSNLTLLKNGNVGVGRNPGHKFEVQGDILIADDSRERADLRLEGNGPYIPAGISLTDTTVTSPNEVKTWAIWKGGAGWKKGLGFHRYGGTSDACKSGGICHLSLMLYDNGEVEFPDQNVWMKGKKLGIGMASNHNLQAKLHIDNITNGQATTLDAIRISGNNSPTGFASKQDIRWNFLDAGSSVIRAYRGDSWDTYLQFLTNEGGANRDNPQVRMHISDDGKIGIGTTTPSEKLHVRGNIKSFGDIISDGGFINIIRHSNWGGYARGLNLINANGTVEAGIGFYGSAAAPHTIYMGYGSSPWGGNNNGMSIRNNGNIGIGLHNPSEKLHVAGNVRANAYFYNSDKRYKTDIKPLNNMLETITRVGGYSYFNTLTQTNDIGLIAQEVEKTFPEIVATDAQGYKTIAYANLVAPIIQAIKELNTTVQQLFDQYISQQAQIDVLEARINALEQK